LLRIAAAQFVHFATQFGDLARCARAGWLMASRANSAMAVGAARCGSRA
jgi:hypothetical protein